MFSNTAVLLFVALVVEVFVVVQAASVFGAFPVALALVVLSAVGVGVFKARSGGLLRTSIQQLGDGGRLDKAEVADGSLCMLGALLLIVPGFVTAALGGLLFLSPVRSLVRPVLLTRFANVANLNLRFGATVVDVDEVRRPGQASTDPSFAQPELGSSRRDPK